MTPVQLPSIEQSTSLNVVNDVFKTRFTIQVPKSRGQLIEDLLFLSQRSFRLGGEDQQIGDGAAIVVYIRRECITVRFHAIGDEEEAKAELMAILANGGLGL